MKKPGGRGLVEPPPRQNQGTLLRVCMITAGLTSAGLFGAVLFIEPEIDPHQAGAEISAAEAELVEVLEDLRVTWDERRRKRILAEAEFRREDFGAALQRILRIREHPLAEQAVDYALALAAPETESALLKLSHSTNPVLSHKAILAVERIQAWSPEKLATFLRAGSEAQKLAVLKLASTRDDAPWEEIFHILEGEDRLLRKAAIESMPAKPNAILRHQLWQLVDLGGSEAVVIGLQAIARTNMVDEFERSLADRLQDMDAEAQLACLELLATRAGELQSSEQVWELASSDMSEGPVRAQALLCLERTAQFDTEAMREAVFGFAAELQYFAARCLLAKRDEAGVEVLINLLDGEDPAVVTASRQLLSWLSGRGASSSRVEFEESRQNMQLRTPLPAPSLEIF